MKLSSQNANRLINKFDEACQNLAFKGAAHPEEWEEIEQAHKRARDKLFTFITHCLLIPSETDSAKRD
jgi:hypothetical protein